MASPRLARFQDNDNADHWPGFVDALATLLLVIVFLLSIFVVGQFALGRELMGRDEQLAALNAQLAQLADELDLTRDENAELETRITGLETEIAGLNSERDALNTALGMARDQTQALTAELESERNLSAESMRAIALLNQQLQVLRDQIATLNAALDAAEIRAENAEAQVINLGERLNAALAERAAELAVYRSDFFGRLRAILGNRTGVRIVGDRFVFETDVLFASGSAALSSEGPRKPATHSRCDHPADAGNPRRSGMGDPHRRPHRSGTHSHDLPVELALVGRPRHLPSSTGWRISAYRPNAWSLPVSANIIRSSKAALRRPNTRNRRIELKLTAR